MKVENNVRMKDKLHPAKLSTISMMTSYGKSSQHKTEDDVFLMYILIVWKWAYSICLPG